MLAHTLSGQALVRQDITPLALTYLGFLLLLAVRVRRGRRPAFPEAQQGRPVGFGPLARHVLVTATAGYAVFLAIDVVFYFVLGGQHASFLKQAVTGGALLAYGFAVPLFLALSWVELRLSHRRPGQPRADV